MTSKYWFWALNSSFLEWGEGMWHPTFVWSLQGAPFESKLGLSVERQGKSVLKKGAAILSDSQFWCTLSNRFEIAMLLSIPPFRLCFCVGSISRWIDCSLQSVILFPADNEDSFPGVVGSEFLSFERPDETRQTVHIGVKWHLVNVQPPALGEPCFYIAFCEDHRTFCLRFLLLVCAVKGVKLATDLSANRPHQTGPGILDMEPVESSLTAVDQSESLEVKHCRATSLHWQSLGKEGWRILSAVVPWTLGIVW